MTNEQTTLLTLELETAQTLRKLAARLENGEYIISQFACQYDVSPLIFKGIMTIEWFLAPGKPEKHNG